MLRQASCGAEFGDDPTGLGGTFVGHRWNCDRPVKVGTGLYRVVMNPPFDRIPGHTIWTAQFSIMSLDITHSTPPKQLQHTYINQITIDVEVWSIGAVPALTDLRYFGGVSIELIHMLIIGRRQDDSGGIPSGSQPGGIIRAFGPPTAVDPVQG